MQSTNIPSKIPLPFGYDAGAGYINPIPTASQIGIEDGRASLQDGFPPDTFTPVAAGGIPPFGGDFNGILNEITSITQWQQAGGFFVYDSAFSAIVGGYPKGAVLQSTSFDGLWTSSVENNTSDPDANGAGWTPTAFNNLQTIALSGTSVTLTKVQAAYPILIFTGVLTQNCIVNIPAEVGKWIVVNRTTGSFNVQFKTPLGTGVYAPQSYAIYTYGDAVNIYYISSGFNTQEGYLTATQGQTVFSLSGFNYVPAVNTLAVFVNGSKQVSGVNYSETNSTSFTFMTGLNVGDIVEFVIGASFGSPSIWASNVLYNEQGTGAVTRTLESKLQEWVSVTDFGADPTGTSDSYTAIMDAISAVGEAGTVYFPAGVYLTSDTITITDTPSVNTFITLKGDGMFASYIVHTGTQTTGCVKITGALYYPGGVYSGYYPLNNGSSNLVDIAVGSNYGPGLYCQFANMMRHERVFIYSAGTASNSLQIDSCIESYFNQIQAGTGNGTFPTADYAKIIAALPTGALTLPVGNIYSANVNYDDGTHGVLPVVNGELFFIQCRTDGGSTGNSVDLRGIIGSSSTETFIVKFLQCKFTSGAYTGTPPIFSPYVVNVNGANLVAFEQCSFEPKAGPSGELGAVLRVTSNLGPTSVIVDSCTGETGTGLVDIGFYDYDNDASNIIFTLINSTFYQIRVSPYAITNQRIKSLTIKDNVFYADFDSSFNNIVNNGLPITAVTNYQVEGNIYGNNYLPCSYQTANNNTFDDPFIRGKLVIDSAGIGLVPYASPAITYATSIPTTGTWVQGSIAFNSSASSGGRIGWMCITTGTFGSSTTTGSIVSGTKLLTVASATGFSINQWITIAGVAGTFNIVSISGLVFTLSNNATSTVTSASVAYVTPAFLNMATL